MTIKTHITTKVAEAMNRSDTFNYFVIDSICRHLSGDCGEIAEGDKASNGTAPFHILVVYSTPDGRKIWINQERAILTVLFPDEY